MASLGLNGPFISPAPLPNPFRPPPDPFRPPFDPLRTPFSSVRKHFGRESSSPVVERPSSNRFVPV
eukprot:8480780-Pyramimonas_sp.AAC.1